MSVTDFMAPVFARLHASKIVRAVLTANALPAAGIAGAFFKEPREIVIGIGAVQEYANTFECTWVPALNKIEEGMPVKVDGVQYRFLRWILRGGETAGLAVCELGIYK